MNRLVGPLPAIEWKRSYNVVLKSVQRLEFGGDMVNIKNKHPLAKNSKLRNLDPFLDVNDLLRVSGRIAEAAIPYGHKDPIFLPSNHHVTRLLITLKHESLLHAGVSQTLASLRMKYWFLRAKDCVKGGIPSCIRCYRAFPKLINRKLGVLPKVRLEPCSPFLNIGLDYLGQILIKEGGKNSKRKVKVWVALFVCLSPHAVHIEIVSDLTSESFIILLKILISRRGFVGVSKEHLILKLINKTLNKMSFCYGRLDYFSGICQ